MTTTTKRRRRKTDLVAPDQTAAARNQVIVWLLEGQRAEDIARAFPDSFPTADLERAITEASDHFETIARADLGVLRGWCLDAFRELYRRSLEVGDHAGAIRAVKELMQYATTAPITHVPTQHQPNP